MRTGRQCGAGVPPAWSPRKPAFSQHRWRAGPRARDERADPVPAIPPAGQTSVPRGSGLHRGVHARHCAGNDPPASRRVDSTRARCLALFSSRKGAWHRSHRLPRGAGAYAWHRSHRVPRGADPALPAAMQAAGAPSVRSQPPQSPISRPRRWCDAGTPAARAAADQKAGDPGTSPNADQSPPPGALRCLSDTRCFPQRD